MLTLLWQETFLFRKCLFMIVKRVSIKHDKCPVAQICVRQLFMHNKTLHTILFYYVCSVREGFHIIWRDGMLLL